MFARKKATENIDPLPRGVGPKKGVAESGPAKLRKGVIIGQTRRAFLGDITNESKHKTCDDGKKKVLGPLKPVVKNSVNAAGGTRITKNSSKNVVPKNNLSGNSNASSESSIVVLDVSSSSGSAPLKCDPNFRKPASSNCQVPKIAASGALVDRVEEDFSFVIDDDSDKETKEEPETLLSIDEENYTDVFNIGIYAQAIFDYYKRREKMFRIPHYMNGKHCLITPAMRAILVDWLVEIQENFELNHETLYLAVKLTDMYLSRVTVDKERLQLVGAASVFIASKFDERCPPLIEDFTYICDNAFERDHFILMEMEILRKVDFDLGIPISYRFLRRYAKVARMSIETLTLARYILELSLMDYAFVIERDSVLAAAALYIAMKMKKEGAWEGEVVKSCGYTKKDIKAMVVALNKMLLTHPIPQLSTIHSKYSHAVFHEVAKIPPLKTEELLL